MSWILIALSSVSLGACVAPRATHSQSDPLKAEAKPATGPETKPDTRKEAKIVEFYCRAGDVPFAYRELNIVTVLGWGRDRETMLRELRNRAREMGADGVVLLDEQMSKGTSLDYSEGSCSLDSVLLRGVAIIYDETENPTGETAEDSPAAPDEIRRNPSGE